MTAAPAPSVSVPWAGSVTRRPSGVAVSVCVVASTPGAATFAVSCGVV